MTTEEITIDLKEWEDFQPAQELSPELSGKLWNGIDKATPPAHRTYFRWMAVAASVLSVVGLSWYFLSRQQKTGSVRAAITAGTREIFNNTPQKMTLTLSDGSKVELSPNSTLSYPEDFNTATRDVILNGEAGFNVAKDVAKPFSVSGNAILITVLGTRFTVRSYEANATKVILQEGSILVKINNPASHDNKHEYYLTPGDIFVFKQVKVNKQPRTIQPEGIAAPTIATPSIPAPTPPAVSNDSLPARVFHLEKDKDGCYAFDNCPLDLVFDELQIIYNTKIIYDKAELGNQTFIGKIDKKDSLYHLLKSISLLNHFGLHKQGDNFVISPY